MLILMSSDADIVINPPWLLTWFMIIDVVKKSIVSNACEHKSTLVHSVVHSAFLCGCFDCQTITLQ